MKSPGNKMDKAVSEVIGYILVFSIVIVVGTTAFTIYVDNTGTNNELTYQSGVMQSFEQLQTSMFKSSSTIGSQTYVNMPMGIQGAIFSQKSSTTLGMSSSQYYNISYKLGLSIQVQGYNPNVQVAYDKVINNINLGSSYNPDGIVFDSTNNLIYAVCYGATSGHHGEIFAINGNQTLGLPLPAHAYGVTYDSGDNTLIMPLYNDTTASPGELMAIKPFSTQYTGSTVQVVNTKFPTKQYLFDATYDPSTGDVISSFGLISSGGISYGGLNVYNASTFIPTRSTITVPIDGHVIPSALTYDPANGMIYVAGAKYIWGINSVTYDLSNLYPVSSPWGIAFDTFNGNLYVTHQTVGSGGLSFITPTSKNADYYVYNGTTTSQIADISVTSQTPTSVIYDPANRHVYVSSFTGYVIVLNGMSATSAPIKILKVGSGAGGGFNAMVYDPTDHNVYVCNRNSGNVSVIQGNSVLSNGWKISNSKLPLKSTLDSSGGLYATGATSFVKQTKFSLEDGTVMESYSPGGGNNLSSLPISFSEKNGIRQLNLKSVSLESNTNLSITSTNTVGISLKLISQKGLTIYSGETVSLVNTTNGQTLTAQILNVYLLSMSYSLKTPEYIAWEHSLSQYKNSTLALPLSVTMSPGTSTVTMKLTSRLVLNSITLNQYGFSTKINQ